MVTHCRGFGNWLEMKNGHSCLEFAQMKFNDKRTVLMTKGATVASLKIGAFLLLISLSLMGCNSGGRPDLVVKKKPEAVLSNIEDINVGDDAVGENCRANPALDNPARIDVTKLFDVRCGTWTRPSGRLAIIDTPPDGNRKSLQELVSNSLWSTDLESRAKCNAAVATQILGQNSALWLKCSRVAGGLPYIALLSVINNKTYLAEGLPTAQTVLEKLIGLHAGLLRAEDIGKGDDNNAKSSAAQLLARQFGNKLVGNADRSQYDRLMQLGRSFNDEGYSQQAAVYFRDALKLQQQLVGSDNAESVYPMMHLALSLSNSRKFVEANQLFDRCDALVLKAKDPSLQAMLLYYESVNYANQGKRASAIKFADKAMELYGKLTRETNALKGTKRDGLYSLEEASTIDRSKSVEFDVGRVSSALILAKMHRAGGNSDESQQVLNKIHDTAVGLKGKFPLGYADFSETYGQILSQSGEDRAGERELRSAVEELNRHLSNTLAQVRGFFNLGAILAKRGRDVPAMASFRFGAKIARDKNFSLPVDTIMPFLDVLYRRSLSNPNEADDLGLEMFEASQLAQSGAAAQLVADAAAQLAQGSGEAAKSIRVFRELSNDVEKIQSQLDAILALPAAQQDKILIAGLSKRLAEAEKRRDDAEEQVQALAPNFNLLRTNGVSAAQLIEKLRPGEAFHFTRLGPNSAYGFLIFEGKVKAFSIPLTFDLANNAVSSLRDAVKVRYNSDRQPLITAYDVQESYDLYQKLFGPVSNQLPRIKKLIIAQSGALLSLPYGMLVSKPSKPVTNFDYRGVNFMINDLPLQYVTSTQSFLILRSAAKPNRAARPFAGFGDYIPPSEASLRAQYTDKACADDLEAMLQLGPLPGTKREVINIAATMGAREDEILLGAEFTKKALLALDLGRFRMLHFATHGLLPNDLKCRTSPTLLATASNPKDLQGVFFETGDILTLKLNSDLVVLSACNTSSQGGGGSGESLSGLAQAFFVAGARGLVVSLWLAADQSTEQLMEMFYRNINSKTMDTASSLRDAQLKIIARSGKDMPVLFSHPLFWAVFEAIGDGIQVDNPKL
ncbi:MAG: CHAT domain-containing protein [Alphaproteobacteria bacterium]|nr:CHAT domain-containing protein [Alphaproteobacteria bacterium]